MPYDEARQLLLEYDNYNNAYRNDETFVPFLNYPILKQISYNQKKTLLDTYQAQLPNDGKNMPGYASFLVGYMELNEDVKAKVNYFSFYCGKNNELLFFLGISS